MDLARFSLATALWGNQFYVINLSDQWDTEDRLGCRLGGRLGGDIIYISRMSNSLEG